MGEKQNQPFQLSFNASLKVDFEDLNDAERLAADPTFRLIGSQRIWDRARR